ncbi:VC0807 family protein [Uliginosibacterium sediminicola]|uniref:VC0807 family protein n=1 Tax=Uliginosibacterium sediminicola TaxID=2024550 RepID=A0ABU9Z189_9RHOO
MLTRKHLPLLLDLAFNLLLPWLAYTATRDHWGEFNALLCSAAPPMIWSLGELLRHRRIDALSIFVLGGIALSAIAMLLGGSPRMLLLRESLISGLFGVLLLVSAAFAKPLVYYLLLANAKRQGEAPAQTFQLQWHEQPKLRARVRLINMVWGVGLTLEAGLRSYLAWHWSAERFLAISPFISYGLFGLLVLWTFSLRRR